MNKHEQKLLAWQNRVSQAWQRSQKGKSLAEAHRDVLAIEEATKNWRWAYRVGQRLTHPKIVGEIEIVEIGGYNSYKIRQGNTERWADGGFLAPAKSVIATK